MDADEKKQMEPKVWLDGRDQIAWLTPTAIRAYLDSSESEWSRHPRWHLGYPEEWVLHRPTRHFSVVVPRGRAVWEGSGLMRVVDDIEHAEDRPAADILLDIQNTPVDFRNLRNVDGEDVLRLAAQYLRTLVEPGWIGDGLSVAARALEAKAAGE